MNESITNAPKTFSILSVGQRGVGKTVFLAGSYAELHSNEQLDKSQSLWFDCQDNQDQENINSILSYITKTGQYPPPTMKITNFNFTVKNRSWLGAQTLCNFRWWDMPGELCNFDSSEFRNIVFSSQSCCVFIDAPALLYQPYYGKDLEEIIQQITPIATLAYMNGLDYSFAVILTKCDILKSDLNNKKYLDEKLQPLINLLETVNAKYKTFYSYIPIVGTAGVSILKAKGSVDSLLWIVKELRRTDSASKSLPTVVNQLMPKVLQPKSIVVEGTLQSLIKSHKKIDKSETTTNQGSSRSPSIFTNKYMLVGALVILSFMTLVGLFLIKGAMLDDEGVSEVKPNVLNRN